MKRKRLFSLLLVLTIAASLVGVPLSVGAQDNVALGAAAIASSEFNSGFGIAKLNDGKGKSGLNGGTNSDRWSADWSSSADNRGEWFGVSFSEKTAVDTIVFYEYNSRMTEYTIEYQDEADGDWKTVTRDGQMLPNQTKEASESGDWTHSVENTVTFDLTEVFGIRVRIVDAAKSGVSIWEFEAYNNTQPPEIDASTNLAILKGTGIADPDKSVSDARFQAVNLNDGSTSGTSRWSSNWGLSTADVVGCWAGIQFDDPTVFNKLTVKEFHGRVTGFVVEVSNDGQIWTPVTVSGEPMQTQVMDYVKTAPNQMRTYDVTFDRVQASYVRYRIVEAGEAGPSLWELEVYDTRAGQPFPEEDDEAAFAADVASVTEQSLLGNNPDTQHVTENLALPASPMAGGTNLTWTVVGGENWLDATGKVTRPTVAEGDQTVQLRASFSSPRGTYTEEKFFTFTVLLYDPAQAEREAFEQDVARVTQDYLLGANPSAQQVKWDLNLPVSPLPNGTEVVWSVLSGTALDEGGNVTRPAQQAEEATLRAVFTKGEMNDTRDFTFTVLPQDMGIWKLVENIKIEDPRGASTYTISQIKDSVNSSTAADGGVRFGQLVAQELASSERPDMKLDFSDSIQAGKKYYIEVTTKTDMKQGETRVTILNGKASEGALFIFRSNNTLGLAADPGSGRTWVDSQVKINHTHGAEETFGIYYDTSADKFQFVSNGEIASSNSYKPSYGGGISGVQVNYQGKAGDLESYTITKGVKVYEYDPDWAGQLESEFAALSAANLTNQDPSALTQNMALPSALPCGAPLVWESSHPQVIAADGTVTMPDGAQQDVQLTVRVNVDGVDLSKTFDFTVLSSTDPRVVLYQDMAQVTYESLTEQDPSALTQNLTMPAALPGGTTVTWTSSNPAILSADGVVSQLEDRSVPVILTAEFTYGGLTEQRTYWFTVLAAGEAIENLANGARILTSAQTVDGAASAVIDGDYQSFWTTNTQEAELTLELSEKKALSQVVIYEHGTSIGSAVLEGSDNNVDYTKIADLGSAGFGKEFYFPIVEAKYIRLRITGQTEETVGLSEIELYFAPTDEERVAADVAAFTYTNPKVVTTDIELPAQSRYGSTITWSSNKPESLDAQGHVARQSSNVDVTLTATFTSGDVQKTVQVYHTVSGTRPSTTPGGGGSGSGGGGVHGGSSAGNSGGLGMSVPVVQPDNNPGQPAPHTGMFQDVTSDRWSYPYIERLAQQNIVDGNGETFDPEGLLTREQLVKLIVAALGLELSGENATFADVQPGTWYSPYIAAAAQAGIVSGISETEFGVGQYVSREDMATMICRAMETAGVSLVGGTEQITFADSGQISTYAQEAVRQLTSLGILSGDGGYFLPQDTATREQGAKVICMVLDKMGR